MSRVIKFRAWDKACNEMIVEGDPNYFKIYLNGSMAIEGVWSTSEVELMQYTGFKDCRNNDVYEGDIVEDVLGNRNLVFWWEIEGCWGVRGYMGDRLSVCCEPYTKIWRYGPTIIGNIHDGIKPKPECLGGKDERN